MKRTHKRLRLPVEVKEILDKNYELFVLNSKKTQEDYEFFLSDDFFESTEINTEDLNEKTILFFEKRFNIHRDKLKLQTHIFRSVEEHSDDLVQISPMTNVFIYKTTGNYSLFMGKNTMKLKQGEVIRFNFHKPHGVTYEGRNPQKANPVIVLSID